MFKTLAVALREAVAPEAAWRSPDPTFKSMVARLSFLFAIPLYDLPTRDRFQIARFYATIPKTAAFIVLRTAEEARHLLKKDDRPEALASGIITSVLDRLFTATGSAQLLEVSQLFTAAHPGETEDIRLVVQLLAVASVHNADAIKLLDDYEMLLANGRALAERDPFVSEQPPVVQAWIAKHWEFCGALFEKAFGAWYVADHVTVAANRVMQKIWTAGKGRSGGSL